MSKKWNAEKGNVNADVNVGDKRILCSTKIEINEDGHDEAEVEVVTEKEMTVLREEDVITNNIEIGC